jgi:hypothetical protein
MVATEFGRSSIIDGDRLTGNAAASYPCFSVAASQLREQ